MQVLYDESQLYSKYNQCSFLFYLIEKVDKNTKFRCLNVKLL